MKEKKNNSKPTTSLDDKVKIELKVVSYKGVE